MIALGSDHAGLTLKREIMAWLQENGYEYKDYGTFTEDSCDYPVFARAVCRAIQGGECEKGLLCCGTGVGISIAANKMKGIRAALCADYFTAKYTRMHNDSNVICLGGRTIGAGLAIELVDVFLNTEFEGGKHARRVQMMMELETEGETP